MRETPRKGSGSWMACLPRRLSPKRAALPQRWDNKADAERALAAAITDIDPGLAAAPGAAGGPSRKVRHLVQAYIDDRATHPRAPLAAKTARDYRSWLRLYICHPKANLGNVAVSRLTTPGLSKWLDDLARAGVSPTQVQHARRLASGQQVRCAHQPTSPARPPGPSKSADSASMRAVGGR